MGSALAVVRANGVKKISAWAAILFTPTLVGTVHGMNFDNMTELSRECGYPLSIAPLAMKNGINEGTRLEAVRPGDIPTPRHNSFRVLTSQRDHDLVTPERLRLS